MDLANYPELIRKDDFKEFVSANSNLIPKEYRNVILMPEQDYLDIPDADFAIVTSEGKRYFPLISAPETVGSYMAFLYLLDKKKITNIDFIARVAYWLKLSCKKFDISVPEIISRIKTSVPEDKRLSNVVNLVDYDDMTEKQGEELPKLAIDELSQRIRDNSYALGNDGKKYISLASPNEIVKAAKIFEREHKRLDHQHRAEYAENVKIAAASHNVDLDDYKILQRYATRQVNEFTKMAIDARITACHDASTRNSLRLIKTASKDARTQEEIKKLADALAELDKTGEWRYHIDSFTPDAYKAFGYVKVANSDLPGEALISSYDLLNLVNYFPKECKEALSPFFKDGDQMLKVIEKTPRLAWGKYPQIRVPFKELYNKYKKYIKN